MKALDNADTMLCEVQTAPIGDLSEMALALLRAAAATDGATSRKGKYESAHAGINLDMASGKDGLDEDFERL